MSNLQQQTATLFAGLSRQTHLWPGTLTLCLNLQPAANLAILGLGGAVLTFTESAQDARASSRAGATDFTVDSLSEALRILKNEIRQRRPIAVALLGNTSANLEAMLYRGVQPQFVATAPNPAPQEFLQRGAKPLHLEALEQSTRANARAEGWLLQSQTASTAAERRECDRNFLNASQSPAAGSLAESANRWLQLAPRLFPRDRERHFWTQKPHPNLEENL